MDTRIEKSLVLGLVRIFTEYGWDGKGAPAHLSDKVSTIEYGLHHGDALAYSTHIKMILQARRKDHQWGLFTSEFVNGISSLLESYAEHNDLFQIQCPKTKKTFSTEVPTENIFKSLAKDAVSRLRAYGNTVIRYSLIEEYGEERVLRDLQTIFPKATLRICRDTHEPDQLREWIYDDGIAKMTIYAPMMPIVVITNGRKR